MNAIVRFFIPKIGVLVKRVDGGRHLTKAQRHKEDKMINLVHYFVSNEGILYAGEDL